MTGKRAACKSFAESITVLCRFLKQQDIAIIDEAMGAVGEYGEVRLVIEKGRVRYVVIQCSYDPLKWKPGCMEAPTR